MERWVQDNPDLEQASPEELRAMFREEYDEFYPKRRLADDSRLLNRGFPVFESLWAIYSPPEHWGRNVARWDPTVEPPRQHIRELESAEDDEDEDDGSETSTLRRGSTDTERQFHPALEYPGQEPDPYNLTDVYYDASMENEPVWPEFPYNNNHHENIIGPHQSGLEAAFLGLGIDDRSTPAFQDMMWPNQHQSGLEALASYYPTEEELDSAAADGFMYDERSGEFVPHDQ